MPLYLQKKDVSNTLGASFKNLGTAAIQILEGSGVAAEQALGTGARIVTGVAETAAEAAETGARKTIRIANVSTLTACARHDALNYTHTF